MDKEKDVVQYVISGKSAQAGSKNSFSIFVFLTVPVPHLLLDDLVSLVEDPPLLQLPAGDETRPHGAILLPAGLPPVDRLV